MKKGKPYQKSRENRGRNSAFPGADSKGGLWLYGLHAVKAALANPQRKVRRLVTTPRAAEELGPESLTKMHPELAEMEAISRLLPTGSVHQGVALLSEPLPRGDLEEVLAKPAEGRRIVV